MKKYTPQKIESKWQKFWQAKKTFAASNKSKKQKKYVLIEFPYPSGAGLHMGHLRPYVAGDVYSRYFRLKGFEVLYPIGWDAFGLPAENYAIKNGVHPKVSTAANIKNAKKQIHSWGISFDWSREVNTTDPDYYKWTQWIFLQFFNTGLAFEATGPINWCPKDKTGLANEEVIDGKCERCGTVVEKKHLRQWYLKITEYAEKLLKGLAELPEWPEPVKLQQENWIGKSTGAEIEFPIHDSRFTVRVFTTRPDTIFGATYMVVAPEHEILSKLKGKIENLREVEEYIIKAKEKSEMARTDATKEKTGVELKGIKAINPATKEQIPVYVADYVLGSYGTGAIMAVPAHDQRDWDFAKKYNLPITEVVQNHELKSESGILNQAFDAVGTLVSSGKFTGLRSADALPKMAKEFGKTKVQYKLRDWVFSRQRYWGEPIPLVFCMECKNRVENNKLQIPNDKKKTQYTKGELENPGWVALTEKDLPLTLPPVKKYEPTGTGESPLAAIPSFVNTTCPKCGGPAKRETNTMPQWAGSSWYWLRYTDPQNKKSLAKKDLLKRWTPVDVYFGGMEHTTLHLLYSRFWNLFLYDQGHVPAKEPYTKRVPHGIILGPDGEKMSKSRGNVVNPDTIVKTHGADTLRMYELFLGPHEATVKWDDKGIIGVRRFLERVWLLAQQVASQKLKVESDTGKVERALNKLIKKVGEDIESFRFNTCISALMEFLNEIKDEAVSGATFKKFLIVLYPFAPHLAEELNELLGFKKSLQLESWPKFDPKKVADETVEIVVQINGKVKDRVRLPRGAKEADVVKYVQGLDKIKTALAVAVPKKIIFVPDRIINFVV